MRVLLLSDTHGALDARIERLARECDVVAHAGDIGDASVLDRLGAGGANVVAVCGNNDTDAKWRAAQRGRLRELATTQRIALPGGDLVVIHGDAQPARTRHARLRALFPDAHAVLYGHSHRQVVDDAAMPWILNGGAAGAQRTFGGPSCLVLLAKAGGWRIEALRFALPARV